MEWFALSSNYWMDPKFTGISATAERLFTRLLGYCRMVNSGGYVCQHGERNVGIARPKGAMDELIARQIVIPAGDGGHYFPAWDKWQQYGDDLQEKRNKERDRGRKRRAGATQPSADETANVHGTRQDKTLQDKTSTKRTTSTQASKPTLPAGFDEFWQVYPRRQGKQDAVKAYAKAIKTVDAHTLISAASSFAGDPNRDPAFTAMPATWLNGGRWDDDPLPSRNTGPAQPKYTAREQSILDAELLKDNPDPRALAMLGIQQPHQDSSYSQMEIE